MKRVRIQALIGVGLLLALLAFSFGAPSDVAAFDHPWANFISTNVLLAERGLWDDVAAGGPAMNEAGLLWFTNNQPLDETVGYRTSLQVSTSAYPKLIVRAALNDNALFRVGYKTPATAGCVYPPALSWAAAEADGVYRVKTFTLPAGTTVNNICIVLTDNGDAVAIGHSNVLIDYIRLANAAGAFGWWENFTGAP